MSCDAKEAPRDGPNAPKAFPPNGQPPPGMMMPEGAMKVPPRRPNVDMSTLAQIPNPYSWPPIVMPLDLTFNGRQLQVAPVTEDPMTRARKIHALPVREDDVILLAFPKCGTHWVAEMISMLLKGRAQYGEVNKIGSMIEFIDDLESLDALPSPRFFNSHLRFCHLPKNIVEKKVKVIHLLRGARDTAVSWYFHLKGIPFTPPEFDFDKYFQGYLTDAYSVFDHQFDFLREMSQFVREHPDHPVKHVHYEDLKEDPLAVLLKVSEFLGVPQDEKLCQEIIEACSFNKMKDADKERKVPSLINPFRKGIIGDWKNIFTQAQSERFDEFIREQLDKGGIDVKPKDIA